MAQTDIRLVAEGPGAEAVAEALSKLILDQFGHRTDPLPVGAGIPVPGKKIDPALLLGATGLILSVPSAVLAVMDLVDRIKKRNQAEEFLKNATAFLLAHPGTEISIPKPDGTHIRIREIDPDALLDLFTEVAR